MRGQKEAEDDSEGSRRVFWLGVEGRQQRADMAAGGPAILTPPPTLPKAASSRHHSKTRLRGHSTPINIWFPLGFPVAQLVKNPPAIWETWVRSLGQEDPLEKEQATHSSVLGLPLWLRW